MQKIHFKELKKQSKEIRTHLKIITNLWWAGDLETRDDYIVSDLVAQIEAVQFRGELKHLAKEHKMPFSPSRIRLWAMQKEIEKALEKNRRAGITSFRYDPITKRIDYANALTFADASIRYGEVFFAGMWGDAKRAEKNIHTLAKKNGVSLFAPVANRQISVQDQMLMAMGAKPAEENQVSDFEEEFIFN